MVLISIALGARWLPAAEAENPAPQSVVPSRPSGAFQLLDGDRVVFVGDTLIERAQQSDYVETLLTARNPDRNVVFRNLGWSGDTVFGDARAGFGTAADGFAQLKQQVYALQPTVIIVGYGAGSSFDGPDALPRFIDGYRDLLEMLALTKAEIILLSPPRHEDLGRPLPDPREHNKSLDGYSRAIDNLAACRGLRFVDLFHKLIRSATPAPGDRLTDNGIHLSAYGYWHFGRVLMRALQLDSPAWELNLAADGKANRIECARLSDLEAQPAGLRFTLLDERLPEPLAPEHEEGGRTIRIADLATGRYSLAIDGRNALSASAGEWASGQTLRAGPEFDQVEELRQAIVRKNRLYFQRWRPQNETYLFGFRKTEQGQNAKEVPMYDPLVAEQEAEIARLRVPRPHTYELRRE